MKKLLMALVLTAFAYSGAQAQVCAAPKHKKKIVHKAKVQHTSVANVGTCRAVPYQVCKINPDRTSVSCYKTMDLFALTPLTSEVTQFGPTGAMPGATEKLSPGTVVIKDQRQGDFCRRDEANRATICQYNGQTLQRDANGVYSYRHLPQEGRIDITADIHPDNSVSLAR